MIFVYRSLIIDDTIHDCLLHAIEEIQYVDRMSSFCLFSYYNQHHKEWLRYLLADGHGVAAYDFASLSGHIQLVCGFAHWQSGVLD